MTISRGKKNDTLEFTSYSKFGGKNCNCMSWMIVLILSQAFLWDFFNIETVSVTVFVRDGFSCMFGVLCCPSSPTTERT